MIVIVNDLFGNILFQKKKKKKKKITHKKIREQSKMSV